MSNILGAQVGERLVQIEAGQIRLEGNLAMPKDAQGVVLFAHGSGSSRHSPRNKYVAQILQEAGMATLLFDLLTVPEESIDARTGHLRFDIPLLANRLVFATDWLTRNPDTRALRIGYFGASTGAAAALVAASKRPDVVHAVVSRGGRPDLAGQSLESVRTPALLIVGGDDIPVIAMNREAFGKLHGEKRIEIVPGATHLFEEQGTLEQVAWFATDWFTRYLRS